MEKSHVVLSPHFDDAALGCGGTIHKKAIDEGQDFTVLTVFAGKPTSEVVYSFPLVQLVHSCFGNPPPTDPVAARRDEDKKAVISLGAKVLHWNYLDAPYRQDAAGGPCYSAWPEMANGFHSQDQGLPYQLYHDAVALYPSSRKVEFFASLAMGGHIDHRIVRDLAFLLVMGGYQVSFYEDLPYSLDKSIPAILGQATWDAKVVSLGETNLRAKIRSICEYRTQKTMLTRRLAGETKSMTEEEFHNALFHRLGEYARSAGEAEMFGERLWSFRKRCDTE